MNRSDVLRALTLSAAGLFIAPDALESLVEPRRKLWPGWSPIASRDEWFVAANGSDWFGDGSCEMPLRTVQRAVDLCSSGSIIRLGPGSLGIVEIPPGKSGLFFDGRGLR